MTFYTEEQLLRFAELVAQRDRSVFHTYGEEHTVWMRRRMKKMLDVWGNEAALVRFMRDQLPAHRSLRTILKPLEEMPPLVEDKDQKGTLSLDALLARWRLEIGR